VVKNIAFNVLALLLFLPILVGIVDLWALIMLDNTLILHWDSQKFTGAWLLCIAGVFVKIAHTWSKA
jgi:putative effector of murein hydrolase LrgA (UPF0299 family)